MAVGGGRCAGPTAADLATLVLPARGLGRRGYDLSGTKSFGAGPFEVTAISHVRARFEPQPPLGGGRPAPVGRSRPRLVLRERAEIDYRVVGVQGTLGASFTGPADPLCRSLGTCASGGALNLALRPEGQTLSFSGQRIVKRAVGARRALEDLRAGRLQVQDSSSGLSFAGTLTGSLLGPGRVSCDSQFHERVSALCSTIVGSGDRFALVTSPDGFPSIEYLRSYCPGPTTSDIVGSGSLATGALPLAALGDRHLTLTLSGSGAFHAIGYQGIRRGTLSFVLVRSRVIARTRRVRVFGGEP